MSVVSLGSRGCVARSSSGEVGSSPAQQVKVVDTCSAGELRVGVGASSRARVGLPARLGERVSAFLCLWGRMAVPRSATPEAR